MSNSPPDLPPTLFTKEDTADDGLFYTPPRLVTHIDEGAVKALTACYRDLLREDGVILDLMSSWVSHLPDDLRTAEVIGHGMNGEELAANPRLDRSFVQDLNRDPRLPLSDDSCDVALCCVGIQYLQQPVEICADVRRVLRPGAPFVISYSNRCFPTKAVAIWLALDMGTRAGLIGRYLEQAGFSAIESRVLADGSASDPLVALIGRG